MKINPHYPLIRVALNQTIQEITQLRDDLLEGQKNNENSCIEIDSISGMLRSADFCLDSRPPGLFRGLKISMDPGRWEGGGELTIK